MMKKCIAIILSLALLLGAGCAAAEAAEKVTIGTVSINGEFKLQCGLPEGYTPVPGTVTPDLVTATIRSEDPKAPIMQLAVAYDEMYYDVERLNDLDAEGLELLEQTFIDNDPDVEISYGETGYGTLLLIARHESDVLDYVTFFSIYKGYCVEFALVPSPEAEDKNLTEEQLRISVQFLTDLDFIPANEPAITAQTLADTTCLANLTEYDPETNTVKADLRYGVTVPEKTADALKAGDTLTAGELSVEIASIERDEVGDLIINDEISLLLYGDEYHVYIEGKAYRETRATLVLEIPDDLTVTDNVDPATGGLLDEAKEYTAEEFRAILAAGGTAEFASDNVLVSFDENGKMIWIERIYSALQ